MRKLSSPRLALEPLLRSHAEELFVALGDARIYQYIDEEPAVSAQALAERYARLETRRSGDGTELWLNWAIREQATGAAIGFTQATVRRDGSAVVAYVISPSRWRQGFAREATAAMLEELEANYGVRRFVATVDERNTASRALLSALGFRDAKRANGDRVYERGAG
jgi:RimJ/RimL family protein N-acetyltransferase